MSLENKITKNDRLVLIALSLLSLWPLVAYRRLFKKLFWFGDELDLLSQVDRQGIWNWLWTPFAENFVPLWKIIWITLVQLVNGSYWHLIEVVWLTHAFTAFIFGFLLLRVGVPKFGAYFGAICFGFAWTNIESLGWMVQSSAIWSLTFLLLAFLSATYISENNQFKIRVFTLIFLSASAFCFARGVLAGPVVAMFLLSFGYLSGDYKKHLTSAILSVIPAILVLILISTLAGGNHQHLSDVGGEKIYKMFEYGSHVFLLNPLSQLLGFEGDGRDDLVWLGAIKIIILATSFYWALKCKQNQILTAALSAFLILDLGNATLLGLGRFHEGLPAATGWRYQYTSLIATLPFYATFFGALCGAMVSRFRIGVVLTWILLSSISYMVTYQWGARMQHWSEWRGREGRQALLKLNPAHRNWLGVPPNVSFDRALELVKIYKLR